MSDKKFGPDRFSRFDVYWIQTNRQTDKPNLYIDVNRGILRISLFFDLGYLRPHNYFSFLGFLYPCSQIPMLEC